MAYRTYANTNGFIVAQNGTADFTTINAAITAINAASPAIVGPKIYLTDTTYTENFTLPNGCLLASLSGFGPSAINGKITFIGTAASLSQLNITNSNGDYAITTSGSLRLSNVRINGNSFDLLQTTGSGSIQMYQGALNLSTTNISYFQLSGSGVTIFEDVLMLNDGLSTKASLISNGLCNMMSCNCLGVFQSSSFGYYQISNSVLNCAVINATPLISGGNGDFVNNSFLDGNVQPALTITSECTITTSGLYSQGGNVISGMGTLVYSDLTFTGPTSIIQSTVIKSLLITNIGELTLGNAPTVGSLLYVGTTKGPLLPLAPTTNGDVLQLIGGLPAWSTPSFPITVGASGTIITSNGTNFVSTSATYPATTTINQLLFSSAANTIGGLSTANNGVLVTSNSGVPSILAGGTAGQVLQSVSGAAPSWSTPTYPSASGTAGQLLRSDGTNNLYTTSTYPNTNAINTLLYASSANVMSALATANSSILVTSSGGVPSLSGTLPFTLPVSTGGTGAVTLTGVLTGNGTSAVTASAVTQYALLVGGASNGVGSIADVAVNQVLVSGGVAANPAYTAYPQISGLGIGASPGSTAGITFDGSNFMSAYSVGTFTPTLDGSVSGTTTYTTQQGYYVKIGKLVFFNILINISAATGTGNVTIAGLPFGVAQTSIATANLNTASFAFPAGTTTCDLFLNGATSGIILCYGTITGQQNLQMANASGVFRFSGCYQST
jgi:hypothetical protein